MNDAKEKEAAVKAVSVVATSPILEENYLVLLLLWLFVFSSVVQSTEVSKEGY